MNISQKIQVEQKIANGFKVKKINTRTVTSDNANPVTSFIEIQLDPLYENLAFLAFATFEEKPPPSEQWIRFGLKGTEDIRQLWKPQKIKLECVCLDYNKRANSGHLIAVSHITAAKKNVLVSAQLLWFGFPFINRFFVGFKRGMRERAEELLLAGLDFA